MGIYNVSVPQKVLVYIYKILHLLEKNCMWPIFMRLIAIKSRSSRTFWFWNGVVLLMAGEFCTSDPEFDDTHNCEGKQFKDLVKNLFIHLIGIKPNIDVTQFYRFLTCFSTAFLT